MFSQKTSKKIIRYKLRYTCGNTYAKPKRTEIKNLFHILILLFLYSSTRLSTNELILIPLEQTDHDNFYAYTDIERIETQWSETILRGLARLLRAKNKEAKQNGSDEKEMATQALNLLQTIIKENEISDTDIPINTIRDYIKK